MRDNVEAESLEDYFRKSITVPFLYCTLRDRPINLQRGLCFFFSFRKICSDNTRVRKILFTEFNIRLYYKNSELNYFFFPPPKSGYLFQQHWESEYFFRKKP